MSKVAKELNGRQINLKKGECLLCDKLITDKNYGIGFNSKLFGREVFICQNCLDEHEFLEERFLDMVGRENLDQCKTCHKYLYSKAARYRGNEYCRDCAEIIKN